MNECSFITNMVSVRHQMTGFFHSQEFARQRLGFTNYQSGNRCQVFSFTGICPPEARIYQFYQSEPDGKQVSGFFSFTGICPPEARIINFINYQSEPGGKKFEPGGRQILFPLTLNT